MPDARVALREGRDERCSSEWGGGAGGGGADGGEWRREEEEEGTTRMCFWSRIRGRPSGCLFTLPRQLRAHIDEMQNTTKLTMITEDDFS